MSKLLHTFTPEDLLYIDTDSIYYTRTSDLPISNRIGDVKQEHQNTLVRIYGKKSKETDTTITTGGIKPQSIQHTKQDTLVKGSYMQGITSKQGYPGTFKEVERSMQAISKKSLLQKEELAQQTYFIDTMEKPTIEQLHLLASFE